MRLTKLTLMVLFIASACHNEMVVEDHFITDDILYSSHQLRPFSGKYTVIYRNTNIPKAVFLYKEGILKGEAAGYYRNGTMKWRGNYENGLQHGKWIFWDEKGRITYEMYFENDTLREI